MCSVRGRGKNLIPIKSRNRAIIPFYSRVSYPIDSIAMNFQYIDRSVTRYTRVFPKYIPLSKSHRGYKGAKSQVQIEEHDDTLRSIIKSREFPSK